MNGIDLLQHIVKHQTPGELTRVMWYKEQSTLEHEYLLFCIEDPDYHTTPTWLRLERMGDIGQSSFGGNSADLLITFAPSYEALVNSKEGFVKDALFGDDQLENVTLDTRASLVQACEIVSDVHDAAPNYRLTRQNCWWLSRKVFKEIISDYVSEGPEKKGLLRNCRTRASGHRGAAYDNLGTVLALLASVKWASEFWPIIFTQMLIHNLSTRLDLRTISRKIKEQRAARRIRRSQRNEPEF